MFAQKNDFFKMFDEDGDGLVSFSEYLMIVTFLAIPLEVSRSPYIQPLPCSRPKHFPQWRTADRWACKPTLEIRYIKVLLEAMDIAWC